MRATAVGAGWLVFVLVLQVAGVSVPWCVWTVAVLAALSGLAADVVRRRGA